MKSQIVIFIIFATLLSTGFGAPHRTIRQERSADPDFGIYLGGPLGGFGLGFGGFGHHHHHHYPSHYYGGYNDNYYY
jgi:hypothetical protein